MPNVHFCTVLMVVMIIRIPGIPVGIGHGPIVFPFLERSPHAKPARVSSPIASVIRVIARFRIYEYIIARLVALVVFLSRQEGRQSAIVLGAVSTTPPIVIPVECVQRRIHGHKTSNTFPSLQPVLIVAWRCNRRAPVRMCVMTPVRMLTRAILVCPVVAVFACAVPSPSRVTTMIAMMVISAMISSVAVSAKISLQPIARSESSTLSVR
mmetsp:Transcript_52504/g.86923  ORF Transcript_52504/g.86923 Transcript_52504/m.86923 type:complete len:210 (+) Transcript_52504:289-918(+)